MLDFVYNTPTKVYFGKGKEKEVGKIISDLGYKKIMFQYGKGSIKRNGLYDTVMNSLKEYNIEVVEVSGVEPNPKLDFVRNAIKIAKETKVEMVLAVGGGSVIDSSKYTALGAVTDVDVWDFAMGKEKPKNALPVGCIPTIAAAGSEMSNSAVITNTALNLKKGCNTEFNRCKFAIMNPELTCSLSDFQTGCGIVDMMTHTMERYFYPAPDTYLTDRIAEAIIKSIVNAGRILVKDPKNYDARATIMWASSLAHNGLTGCGRENYLAVHKLEHAVSGIYDNVAHGAGLAVLYPAWAEYVAQYNYKRFATFFRNVFDIKETDEKKATLNGIKAMKEFFKELKMPDKLRDFNIPESAINDLALNCSDNKKSFVKSYIPLGYKEVYDIFKLCY